jgi:hypothetical protein
VRRDVAVRRERHQHDVRLLLCRRGTHARSTQLTGAI